MVHIPSANRAHSFQIGDFVSKAGVYTKPGVVVEKKDDGTLVIDTDQETIDKYHKHSNTTGLAPQDKDKFNAIMDEIMAREGSANRIANLQKKIDGLQGDSSNRLVVERLRNEQSQLIRLSKELPRIYQYPADKIG